MWKSDRRREGAASWLPDTCADSPSEGQETRDEDRARQLAQLSASGTLWIGGSLRPDQGNELGPRCNGLCTARRRARPRAQTGLVMQWRLLEQSASTTAWCTTGPSTRQPIGVCNGSHSTGRRVLERGTTTLTQGTPGLLLSSPSRRSASERDEGALPTQRFLIPHIRTANRFALHSRACC